MAILSVLGIGKDHVPIFGRVDQGSISRLSWDWCAMALTDGSFDKICHSQLTGLKVLEALSLSAEFIGLCGGAIQVHGLHTFPNWDHGGVAAKFLKIAS